MDRPFFPEKTTLFLSLLIKRTRALCFFDDARSTKKRKKEKREAQSRVTSVNRCCVSIRRGFATSKKEIEKAKACISLSRSRARRLEKKKKVELLSFKV
jgi:hypothetical protein